MSKTTIDIPDEELAELVAIAQRESRSWADVVREALRQYVTERRLPSWTGMVGDDEPAWPRSIGMIKEDDGSLRSDNVDEWLKENWRPE